MAFLRTGIESGQNVQKAYNVQHGYIDRSGENYTAAGKANILSNVMLVALFVIGIVAATGAMSATAAGWTAVGLGGAALAIQFCGGNLKNRKVDLILAAVVAATIITMGALGGAGVLTGAQVGYSLIGIIGTQAIFYLCCCRAHAKHQENKARQAFSSFD